MTNDCRLVSEGVELDSWVSFEATQTRLWDEARFELHRLADLARRGEVAPSFPIQVSSRSH